MQALRREVAAVPPAAPVAESGYSHDAPYRDAPAGEPASLPAALPDFFTARPWRAFPLPGEVKMLAVARCGTGNPAKTAATIPVTGATRGVASEIVVALAGAGWQVFALACGRTALKGPLTSLSARTAFRI